MDAIYKMIEAVRKEATIQFERISQLQVQLDMILKTLRMDDQTERPPSQTLNAKS